MKLNNKNILIGSAIALIGLSSCENQDATFPDFDYQTVYFANQCPVRTLELGEDLYVDNSLDNQRKVKIVATMGGVYQNTQDRVIDFKVDESLCDNLYFAKTDTKVTPLPEEYYTLASNQIVIPSGSILGGVEVQLTDAFFEDEKCLSNNYVIPVVMTDVQGVDSILQGTPQVDNPNRCLSSDWSVVPRDYVLYAIKYVNPWHGVYLRRGIDVVVKSDGSTVNEIRHKQYVENDEEVNLSTNSLKANTLSLTTYNESGQAVKFNLKLAFADDQTCTVSGTSDDYEISGSGKFVSKGEKNSMGGKDRDAIYLDYSVNFKNLSMRYATKDTLVLRNRGVAPEYFSVEMK